jgi:hypothetical protein
VFSLSNEERIKFEKTKVSKDKTQSLPLSLNQKIKIISNEINEKIINLSLSILYLCYFYF